MRNNEQPYAKDFGKGHFVAYQPKLADHMTIYAAIVFNQLYRMLEYRIVNQYGEDALSEYIYWDAKFYMSLKKINAQTRLPISTISDCLHSLAEKGFISIHPTQDKNYYAIEWRNIRQLLKESGVNEDLILPEN